MDCAKPFYDHSESGHIIAPPLPSFNNNNNNKEKYHHCHTFDKAATQINRLHFVEKVIY